MFCLSWSKSRLAKKEENKIKTTPPSEITAIKILVNFGLKKEISANLILWLGLLRMLCFLIDFTITYWFGFQSTQGQREGWEEGRRIRVGVGGHLERMGRCVWRPSAAGFLTATGKGHHDLERPNPFCLSACQRGCCPTKPLTHLLEFCRDLLLGVGDRGLHG